MRIKFGTSLIAFLITFNVLSQSTKNDVLFTVDGEEIYTSEFLRVYNKNLDLVKDESQKDVDNYLNLFIDYKLKLKEAKKLGLDKKPKYLRELANYRKQLTKNYLTDSNVTEALVKEAYDRISYEVDASHVLIRLPETEEDTVKAYNEILKLRERVLNEGFDKVKTEVHNGQTVFAEDLGYFSGFKMVYDFETAAFNTPIGEISKPFRTRFGYHVVLVNNKRKSRGEVEVAHIMISKKSKDTLQQDLKERIHNIYNKIKQGENFESLAKEFSEDKSSASKGGKLSPFSGGQLSSKIFEETAFSLNTIDEVSQPLETEFGWHILKLLDKKPVQPFDKMKAQLELKVNRDARSKLINEAFVNKLKSKYGVKENKEAVKYFVSIVNQDFLKRTWKIPEDLTKEKTLNTIGSKTLTFGDFANYLLTGQRKIRKSKSLNLIVKEMYTEYLNQSVLNYYDSNLENENKEFANIVNEYRDGLLLFDLMESEIWNAAQKDSLGLKEFYTKNKDRYFLNERVDAVVASSPKEKVIKKVVTLFEKGLDKNEITETLNKKGKVNIIFTSGVMDKSHQAIPESLKFEKGISDIYNHNNSYIVAKINNVIPRESLSFEDARGRVISDFQEHKEKVWLAGLHKNYRVTVNNQVLDQIKAKINN